MKKLLTPIVGFAAGAAILAGCSTGGAGTTPDSTTTGQPSTAPSAQGMPQGQRGGGVSGEIVFAQDGTLQVQNSQSQTAVRYTADTTVDQQVTFALANVTVGSCVVAIVGDDGTATSVRVTQPVDGECTSGFPGGGQGGPGGDGSMPSGAPTTMPDAGDRPSDMPSGAPGGDGQNGQAPGGGFAGTFVAGSVTAVSAAGLTVKTDSDSSEVVVGASTVITGTEAADQSAIAVGMCVTAQGKADDAGGFDATSLTLSVKGDDGCSQGFGGMRGGPNGQGGNRDQNGGGNG